MLAWQRVKIIAREDLKIVIKLLININLWQSCAHVLMKMLNFDKCV